MPVNNRSTWEDEEEDQEFKVILVYIVSQPGLHETLFKKKLQGKEGRNREGERDEQLRQMPGRARGVLGKESDLASIWGM